MAAILDSFRAQLVKLIAKFDADKPHYLSKAYSEAQARIDFVTPFFKALGWDVENEAGLPHHEREVIVEKGEAETEGRPDYGFVRGSPSHEFSRGNSRLRTHRRARSILQAEAYAWNVDRAIFVLRFWGVPASGNR